MAFGHELLKPCVKVHVGSTFFDSLQIKVGVAREGPCAPTPDLIESRYLQKCQLGQRSNICPITFGSSAHTLKFIRMASSNETTVIRKISC